MEHLLDIETTARFHTLGDIHKNIKAVWFVFHGYSMCVDEFIDSFKCIADDQTLIVAPEGLHRFYSRGTEGKVTSSWMTSDLREEDIKSNIKYLNSVIKELFNQGLSNNVSIGILGFSQGSPTSVRWASSLDIDVKQIVVWGSNLPNDVLGNIHSLKKINSSQMKFIVGSKDKYISEDQVDYLIVEMHDKGVDFDFHTFEGGHEMHEDSIRYFHARLIDEKLEY